MNRRSWLLVVALLFAACGGGDRVIVGAGTTTVDSGFMAALEEEYGRDVSIVPGSTAELLELTFPRLPGPVEVDLVQLFLEPVRERRELVAVGGSPVVVAHGDSAPP